MEFQLSWSRMIEFAGANHTAQVSLQNDDVLSGQLAATKITVKTDSGQVVIALTKVSNIRIRAGSIGGDYVNSLGVEFVFVPGTKVLFSIWDARVQDYRAYADANPGVEASWKSPSFKQEEDHPVVKVSWEDAQIFCRWLTAKERKEGKIGQNQQYRLPTDAEWSIAVGLGEEKGITPAEKSGKVQGVYPWGKQWPPPPGAGNYADETAKKRHPDWTTIPGYDDGYVNTSPVGSFAANRYGLYDMGGNVWQWCEDWLNDTDRVLRGASWGIHDPWALLSSFRGRSSPDERNFAAGFRCVLAPVSSSR